MKTFTLIQYPSRTWLALLLAPLAVGCATPLELAGIERLTIERADDVVARPQWASVTTPSFEKDGKTFFLGYIEVDGQAAKSAALNMSDEKALSEPMRSVVAQFMDQNQVGESLDQSTGRRILSATRNYRAVMPGLKISGRYWEVVETRTRGVSSQLSLRAFSLAEIPTSELERAARETVAKLKSDSDVKQILDEVGKAQRQAVLQPSPVAAVSVNSQKSE